MADAAGKTTHRMDGILSVKINAMKVYGPYKRKDGREHVIHYDGVTRRTQSYPRYLMEQYLGRELEDWEQVDHINDDPTDNRLENLQILSGPDNVRKSVKGEEIGTFICPTCLNEFELVMRQYRANQLKQGKSGPFCSKSCAGHVGQGKRTDPFNK